MALATLRDVPVWFMSFTDVSLMRCNNSCSYFIGFLADGFDNLA